MKKTVLFILMLLIFLASIGIGYFYLNSIEKRGEKKQATEFYKNIVENKIVSTESKEIKISPNTEITTITLYKKCGHEITENKSADIEVINLDEDEFKEKYKGYAIETFSESNISLYKEENEFCNEHFFIGEENGIINIYKLNSEGEEELYETTNILISYFPEEEQEEIRNKKSVIGKEELYKVLENFES